MKYWNHKIFQMKQKRLEAPDSNWELLVEHHQQVDVRHLELCRKINWKHVLILFRKFVIYILMSTDKVVSGNWTDELVPDKWTNELVLDNWADKAVPGNWTDELVPGKWANELVPGNWMDELVHGKLMDELVPSNWTDELLPDIWAN
jgi:hypothetical protein